LQPTTCALAHSNEIVIVDLTAAQMAAAARKYRIEDEKGIDTAAFCDDISHQLSSSLGRTVTPAEDSFESDDHTEVGCDLKVDADTNLARGRHLPVTTTWDAS
jgi:hypothetical protein